jgi:hypothetical protein
VKAFREHCRAARDEGGDEFRRGDDDVAGEGRVERLLARRGLHVRAYGSLVTAIGVRVRR